MPLQNYGPAPGQAMNLNHPATSPYPTQHIGSGPAAFPHPTRPRQERNFQEIDRLKSNRRAEIRRRCLELDPPIQLSTLDFMDAFNAAVQIARPLNENDWEVLKSRLLAQRDEAEQKERQMGAAAHSSQLQTEERQKFEEQRRQAQETADKIWNEIQKPSRDKAREYAEEYIKANWADGRAVNKMSSGRFAADVLMHVRRRYFETIGQEDTLLVSQSMTIPHDSPIHEIRRLKLEDMKSVYEETIRPRIDRFGREIFLCNTCETTAKRFTFDAVIQHFAAKHTSALSHGNTVVYWRADWPAEPPFHPTPDTVWNRPPEHRAILPPFGATSPAYTPAYTPYPGASWMSPLAPGQPNGIYHVQCEELVASAKRIWDALDEIRYLPNSLRLHVVLHQVSMSFSRRFTNEPTLAMFGDCVNHKPLLKPLKDISGLTCRACHTYGESSNDATEEYSLPDLLQHFQRNHVEYDARSPQAHFTRPMSMSSISNHRMDWKFDMVDLPPEPLIRGILRLPGMDQQKLEMIAEALPTYFPPPIPRIDPVPFVEEEYVPQPYRLPPAQAYSAGGHDPKASFKRPLEEDPYSYPPSLRRVVEYDPYRAEIPIEGYRTEGRPETYLGNATHGRIVYVERGHPANSHVEARPFPRPHTGSRRYPAAESMDDGTHPYLIREAIDDYTSGRQLRGQPRFREPLLVPRELRGRPVSPHRDQEGQYRADSEGLSSAEQFLNNFDTTSSRAYDDESGLVARVSSQSRLVDRGSRSHATTPARSRHAGEPLDLAPGSRRHSPHPGIPERLRSRDGSPIPPLDGAVRTPRREVFTLRNEETIIRDNDHLAPSPRLSRQASRQGGAGRSPQRRPEERPSPRGEGAVPYEYDHYADDGASMPQRGFYDHQPPSPEVRYQRIEERHPIRYIETLPNGQRRVVEELPSPTFERIEYVGPSRETYYMDRGEYLVDRPRPPPLGYRLEHEMERGVYSRPPLYEDGANYQRYDYGPRPSDQGLPPTVPHGLRNVKYEDEPYDAPEPTDPHRRTSHLPQ